MPFVDSIYTSPDYQISLYTDPVNTLLLDENIVAGSAGTVALIAAFGNQPATGGVQVPIEPPPPPPIDPIFILE